MLLEILDEKVISIDEKPIIKNFRVNLSKGRNALRAKFDYIGEEDITPIDLVIFSYSNPRLEKVTSIVIDVNGKEFNKNIPFTVKLSINIIRKKFHLSGCVAGKMIDSESDNIYGLFPDVIKLLK